MTFAGARTVFEKLLSFIVDPSERLPQYHLANSLDGDSVRPRKKMAKLMQKGQNEIKTPK